MVGATSAKALQYLQQLEDARCDGNWNQVPELVRKIRKHAPDRACLALTAEIESIIATASKGPADSGTGRPGTAISPHDLDAENHLQRLLDALEAESQYVQDKYQAQVCSGWLQWIVGGYTAASKQLPKSFEAEYPGYDTQDPPTEWTQVCSLRSVYLKADCRARKNDRIGALEVFESIVPSLTALWTGPSAKSQLRYWSELVLTEFCRLQSQALEQKRRTLRDPNCLACYRTWAKYWETLTLKGAPPVGGYGFVGAVPRRLIWREYYIALSGILEEDWPFPAASTAPTPHEKSGRSQLRAELKKVEAILEHLVIAETAFPKADDRREEVEAVVGLAMKNWHILNGRAWREQDLGPGGRTAMSRGLLNLLYRAAAKTFHSTPILRYLFIVHLSLADFDLAFKSFDTYWDIIKRGKARVEKTGHPEPNLDPDAIVLQTFAHCISALCRYGDREAAEKARDLGLELAQFFNKLVPSPATAAASPRSANGQATPAVPPAVISVVWQAIGISQANWSRVTHDATIRTDIQSKAIRALKTSLSPEFGHSRDIRSLFALGLLLAEQRDLNKAIEVVKAALTITRPDRETSDLYAGPHWEERSLIPLWHLLALLLSARQEYIMASRACEGAFEQFKDPVVLFGSQDLANSYRSDHLKDVENPGAGSRGLVDDMDDFEKETILEVKMTQLALLELLEGPEVAVNASYELLTLYTRLFGSVKPPPRGDDRSGMEVPKSSAGTLRSIKGSIFGGRSTRQSSRQMTNFSSNATDQSTRQTTQTTQSRPQTTQTTASTWAPAPTIQITHENDSADGSAGSRSARTSSVTRRRSESARRHNSLKKRDSSASRQRAASSHGGAALARQPTVFDGEAFFTPHDERAHHEIFGAFTPGGGASPALPTRSSLAHADSYASLKPTNGVSSSTGEVSAARRSAINALPVIQFPREQESRRRKAVLARVWLMIGGFYRRAGLFEDAKSAGMEAKGIVESLEGDIANDTSGDLSLEKREWGARRSVEELWADVWAEFGHLSVAKDTAYEARADFESALNHFPDHPSAIVGLSNILLDIYSEKLLPPPVVPRLTLIGDISVIDSTTASVASYQDPVVASRASAAAATPVKSSFPPGPLGLDDSISMLNISVPSDPTTIGTPLGTSARRAGRPQSHPRSAGGSIATDDALSDVASDDFHRDGNTQRHWDAGGLPPPYKTTSLPLADRLAARDRAHALLTTLTRLGSAWNDSDAWFALSRAHEESGQADKAKEALWWVVELEEARAVRPWTEAGCGCYVI